MSDGGWAGWSHQQHHPPTTNIQCEAMRVSAEPLQGGCVTKWEKTIPGVNNKYVRTCKKKSTPNEKNTQQCTSTTTPSENNFSSFYDAVLYILLLYAVQIRAQYFSQLKTVGRAETFGHRRKGSTQSERRQRKHALGWHGRDCRRGTYMAWFASRTQDFGTRLWRRKSSVVTKHIYIYILQYIVDNTGRHDIDFGREGLIHGLDLFGH